MVREASLSNSRTLLGFSPDPEKQKKLRSQLKPIYREKSFHKLTNLLPKIQENSLVNQRLMDKITYEKKEK